MQTTIFDMLYPKYKITKPIRLIEMFSGYGSQALALKYLGVEFEHWKTCEWAIKSIQAYKDIHFSDDDKDYSDMIPKEDLVEILYKLGISNNYNEPMKKEQIKRLSEDKLRIIYNNINATNNLVNIQQVKGKDLEIQDTDKYDYILTYSFPCQDLSLAGKGKGMSDTSTRSGMLWEVERILTECKELDTLPQILLMENVTQVHGTDNVNDFNKWQLRLEELGYKNYWQDLIATDYGIPQIRNRTFMISILGDYSYSFPEPIPLKLKLKDLLEDNVDEKYYLSDKMLKYCMSTSSGGFDRSINFVNNLKNENVAQTITTKAGNRATDNFIKVKNATKKGYLEATDGDGIDISSRMEYHRGTVQKDKSQTLTTSCDVGVLELKKELCNKLIEDGKVKENDVIRHSYSNSRLNEWDKRNIEHNNLSPTLDTRCDCLGVVNNLRIRKLTPLEVWRLMGVKDEDFEKCAKNQSNSSLWHLAGDSIITLVLIALFGELLQKDYKKLIERWNYNE